MNFAELKEKVKEILKEDETDPETEPVKYSFRDSFQYNMVEMVVGLMFIILAIDAFEPEIFNMTFKLNTDGGISIMLLFTLCLVGYVLVNGSLMLGSWLMNIAERIGRGIWYRVNPSQTVIDILMVLLIFGFIIYKIYNPFSPIPAR